MKWRSNSAHPASSIEPRELVDKIILKCLKSLDLNSLASELLVLQIIHVSRMVP